MTRMSQCLDVIRSLDPRGRASPLGRPRPVRHPVRHDRKMPEIAYSRNLIREGEDRVKYETKVPSRGCGGKVNATN